MIVVQNQGDDKQHRPEKTYAKLLTNIQEKLGLHKTGIGDCNILIYDMDSDTVDVSIFTFDDGSFKVKAVDLSCPLSRARYDELNMECLMGPVEKCLRDSGIDKRQVHEVVLLGDSTHTPIPKVQALIQEFFYGTEPCKSTSPTAPSPSSSSSGSSADTDEMIELAAWDEQRRKFSFSEMD